MNSKNYLNSLLFVLFFISYSTIVQGQEKQFDDIFPSGYIILKDSMILHTKIIIFPNGDNRIQITDGENFSFFEKTDLLDYGIVLDDKKISKYANTFFSKPTLGGYYIKKKSKEKIPFFMLQYNGNRIIGYSLKKNKYKRTVLEPREVETVMVVQEDGKKRYCDAIVLSPMTEYRVFRSRLVNGKLTLNTSTTTEYIKSKYTNQKEIRKKIKETYYEPIDIRVTEQENGNHLLGLQTISIDVPTYILKKDNEVILIMKETKTANNMSKLAKIVYDYPELVAEIKSGAYTNREIPEIIRKYNDYIEKKDTGNKD